MNYTFVYRKYDTVKTAQFNLEEGEDLALAIKTGQVDILAQLEADKNSPLFAIVK